MTESIEIDENGPERGISSETEEFLRALSLSIAEGMWDSIVRVEHYGDDFDVTFESEDYQDFGNAYGRAMTNRGYVLVGSHAIFGEFDGIKRYTFVPSHSVSGKVFTASDNSSESRTEYIERKFEDAGLDDASMVLRDAAKDIVRDNLEAAEDYRNNEPGAENYLVGQVMSEVGGKYDPKDAAYAVDYAVDEVFEE